MLRSGGGSIINTSSAASRDVQPIRVAYSAAKSGVEGSEDDWIWSDEGGDSVRLHFERSRLVSWQLERAPEQAA